MKDLLRGLVLLAVASPVFANGLEASSDVCYRLERLLDPAQPADVVELEMTRLRAAAEGGEAFPAYLLGAFYRLGPAHPAARLPQDGQLAREWLLKAARAGNLGALGALAELDLAEQRPRDALVHALVYAHYGRKYPKSATSHDRGQPGSQVNRAFTALNEPRTDALEADLLVAVNAFVAEHGEAIEASILRPRDPAHDERCPDDYDRERWPLEGEGANYVIAPKWSPTLDRESFGLFHLSIDAKGRVAKALVVDFWPDAQGLDALRKVAEDRRFNKLRDAPPRTAMLPVKLRS